MHGRTGDGALAHPPILLKASQFTVYTPHAHRAAHPTGGTPHGDDLSQSVYISTACHMFLEMEWQLVVSWTRWSAIPKNKHK